MIFVNSFPKSGTGLIRQLLSPFGDTFHFGMYDGGTGCKQPHTQLCQILREGKGQQIGSCTMHLHWRPDFAKLLSDEKVIFLIRDPRDIVVSHAHYIMNTPAHHLHSEYQMAYLEDFDENIRKSIRGIPEATYEFPDIANRFLPYLGWLFEDNVLVVKYEDLVEHQEDEVRQIVKYLETACALEIEDRIVETMLAAVDPESSPTFREGKTGRWTENFSMPNNYYWKRHFLWLLEVMGYEEMI